MIVCRNMKDFKLYRITIIEDTTQPKPSGGYEKVIIARSYKDPGECFGVSIQEYETFYKKAFTTNK